MISLKRFVPKINYFNQDFVDVYVRSWNTIDEYWQTHNGTIFTASGKTKINQYEACFSTFYQVYSNRIYNVSNILDDFYDKQEANGAIRGEYDIATGSVINLGEDNPNNLLPPLFSWSEFDMYHKVGTKKQRIKDVLPKLEAYFKYIDELCFDESVGLYKVPISATGLNSKARKDAVYPIDYNCQQALNAFYLAELGDILNMKEFSFVYKRRYFMLKTKINEMMWDKEDNFYYDLDKNGKIIKVKTLAAYWSLLAMLPNKESVKYLVDYLKDETVFGTPNPFPSIAVNEADFDEQGGYFCGDVRPELTFMVIKGLEKCEMYEFAREVAIRHLYFIIDTFHSEDKDNKSMFFSAYQPYTEGHATSKITDISAYLEKDTVMTTSLITITVMIENVIGLLISLPRKTVEWVVPILERMEIEKLSLKRNEISILVAKNSRGSWEIKLESEKLYYFTANLLNIKKKTWPIPNGRCSMLIDKL